MKGRKLDLKILNYFGSEKFAKNRFLPAIFNSNLARAMLFFIVLLSGFSLAATVGHNASVISAGSFESGNYTFPDSLEITNMFIVGTNVLYVDKTNGRVGVGTSAPLVGLHVTDSSGVEGILLERTGGSGGSAPLWFQESGGQNFSLRVATDGSLRFRSGGDPGKSFTGGTDTVTFEKDGTVGIGTTSPNKTLTILGNLSLAGPEYISCTSLETDAEGGVRCGVDDGGTASTSFWAGSSVNEIYNDTTSGVGIGTTNPSYKLEVNSVDSAMNVSGMLYVNSTSVGIGTSVPGSPISISGVIGITDNILFDNGVDFFWKNSTGTSWSIITLHTDNNLYLTSPVNADMIFRVGGYTERMRIDSNGNVGIGTKTLNRTLTILGNLSLAGPEYISCTSLETDAEGGVRCGVDDGGSQDNTNIAFLNETQTFTLNNTFNENVIINTRLGVGIDNPDVTLHVNSSAIGGIKISGNFPLLQLHDFDTENKMNIEVGRVDAGMTIYDNGFGGVVFYIENTTGNVGIGTTTVNKTLTVLGNMSLAGPEYVSCTSLETDAEGGVRCGSDSTGTSPDTYWAGSAANEIYNDTTTGVGIGTNNPNYKLEVNSVDTALNVSGMLYVNSTSVGIGTSNPTRTLEVAGGPLLMNGSNIYIFAVDPIVRWQESDATEDNTIWEMRTQLEQMVGRVVNDAYSLASNWIQIDRTGTTIDSVVFPNGMIGIGTTSPNRTLTVLGNMSLAGPEYVSCTSLETDAEGGIRCGTDDGGTTATTFWAGSAVNEIYNDTTAGVGIGTNNPNYKLEVNSVDTALNVSGMLYVNSTNIGIGIEYPFAPIQVNANSQGAGTGKDSFGSVHIIGTTPYIGFEDTQATDPNDIWRIGAYDNEMILQIRLLFPSYFKEEQAILELALQILVIN